MIDMMDADGEQNAYKVSGEIIILLTVNSSLYHLFIDAGIASDSYSIGDNVSFPQIVEGKSSG